MKVPDTLRQFDAYPKTLEDFRVKTYGGGIVSIICSIVIMTLFLYEVNDYLTINLKEELFVDTSRDSKLKINFDIIVSNIACDWLSLDAIDASGDQHLQIEHNVYMRRLDLNGQPIEEPKRSEVLDTKKTTEKPADNSTTPKCGDCYGAATEDGIKCCNTCEDVRRAYRAKKWAINDISNFAQCKSEKSVEKMKNAFKEGCQIYGYMEVNRVGGRFHIAPGESFSINHVHVHDVQLLSASQFNLSHKIRHISFGTNISGKTNPLDHTIVTLKGESMCNYYLKIVPTTFVRLDGSVLRTNQFSVIQDVRTISQYGESGMPGIFFTYEFSPLMVKYTQTVKSFSHFLTNTCAIIGGTFTVASILDAFAYYVIRLMHEHKIELGKVR